jgi:hypothetical protein
MTTHPNRIDVHHHLMPPAFVSAMEAKGLNGVAGAPHPHWTPAKSIETMDAHGIATAILSLSAPGVHLDGSRQEACDLARACNEYPFAPAVVTDLETRALQQLTVLDPQMKATIDRAHALKLFPRFGPPAQDAGRPHEARSCQAC